MLISKILNIDDKSDMRRFSNLNLCLDENSENPEIQNLLVKYRGLEISSLDVLNPFYSCVICANQNCRFAGKSENTSCPNHIVATEEQFAKLYNSFIWK